MTRQVFFHIGTPKTGTTYLQEVFLANRDRLADNGTLYVGKRWIDHSRATMVVREHPRLEKLPKKARGAWRRLRDEALSFTGDKAIISHEYFCAASKEQAGRAIADLAPTEVHLVLTVRDLASLLPAAWQQQVKYQQTQPLTKWWPKDASTLLGGFTWRTLDVVDILNRWAGHLPPEQVHIVTVPPPGTSGDSLLNRFADVGGIDLAGCDTEVSRTNQSLGVVETELMRRVNEHITGPITHFRELPVWLRDYLAETVLVRFGNERFRLSEEQIDALTDHTAETISYLRRGGFSVHGNLDDLLIRDDQEDRRTPDDVVEAELNAVAVRVIAALLQDVRREAQKNRD